eukprot:GDKH01009100.1.p1 GENE.GDKH01009100.1~~GDKH01009100.1.p1  ORF type:complete len:64 (-),score=2.75 GDKH01009100.1:24-215(-)
MMMMMMVLNEVFIHIVLEEKNNRDRRGGCHTFLIARHPFNTHNKTQHSNNAIPCNPHNNTTLF